jgi:hypothetical protein
MKCYARKLVLVCGLLGVSSAALCQSVTPPEHPITTEQVRQMMELTHSADRMKESVSKMIQQQKAAVPFFPDAFWTDFESEFAKLDWVSLSAPIYQKYMSTEDADKAIAFYKTSAGQRALEAGFSAYNDMAQVGFQKGREIGQRLGEKYKEQIAENMKKAQQTQGAPPTQK